MGTRRSVTPVSPGWCCAGTPTSSRRRPGALARGPLHPPPLHGVLHGRGTCDMKGGLVAALAAARAVATSGVRLARPLAVHSVVGEEDGGLGAWATLRAGHRGGRASSPSPPPRGDDRQRRRAHLPAHLTGLGRARAMRDQGVSAVELFAHVHAALQRFEARGSPTSSGSPHRAALRPVDRHRARRRLVLHRPRPLVAEGRYAAWASTNRSGRPAPRSRRPSPEPAPSTRGWWSTPPGGVGRRAFAGAGCRRAHRLLPAVPDAVVAVGRPRPVERYVPAGTDLRLYAAAGVPTLHYGPGDLGLAHSPHEQVPVPTSARGAGARAHPLRQCTVEA